MDYSKQGNNNRRRKLNSQTTRVRNKISLLVLRITMAVVLVAGMSVAAGGLGLYLGIIQASPEMSWDNISVGSYSSVIVCARTGEEQRILHGGMNHIHVPLEYISPYMINAIVAIEDERFFEHNGIDIRGIGRALYNALTTDSGTQGASTITQQLIKNHFERFDGELVWKLQEQQLALQMERELTEAFGCRLEAKNFILEMYLNLINLGRQNYGVQTAAQFYFGVDAIDLNLVQAAVIAAIPQNPSITPDLMPARNWARALDVLYRMYVNEMITYEEWQEARNADVSEMLIRDSSTMAVQSMMCCFHDALVAQVRDDLMNLNGWTRSVAYNEIFSGGLTIHSVQNLEMQAIVDAHFLDSANFPQQDFAIIVQEFVVYVQDDISGMTTRFRRGDYRARNMEEVEAFKERVRQEVAGRPDETITFERALLAEQPQAAFVLMDHHNGHVLAIRGVRGEKQASRSFCRATRAERSQGSQLKPLASFLPAFELGLLTPSTMIEDIPLFIPQVGADDHGVRNWYRNPPYEGFNNARRAIYHSGNVVSVRTVMDYVGIETMWQFMLNLGFSTLVDMEERNGRWVTDRNYVLPIGGLTDGLLLIEMAGAYGAIANGGHYNRPVLYSHVVDRHGNIILQNHHQPRRIMRDTTAYLLIDTMKDTVIRGTGTAANWIDNAQMRRDIPIAGKTGTTDRSRDLGFTGFTPYFTAAVWLGNDDQVGMSTSTVGGMGPARLFHLPLWRNIMQAVHEDLPPRQFDRPAGIVTQSVCRVSGMLPSEYCRNDPRGSRLVNEIFASGTVPTQVCTIHQQFNVCYANDQFIAGHFCSPMSVVRLVRPVPILPNQFTNVVIADRRWTMQVTEEGEIAHCTSCGGGWNHWDGWNQWDNWNQWGEHGQPPVVNQPWQPPTHQQPWQQQPWQPPAHQQPWQPPAQETPPPVYDVPDAWQPPPLVSLPPGPAATPPPWPPDDGVPPADDDNNDESD